MLAAAAGVVVAAVVAACEPLTHANDFGTVAPDASVTMTATNCGTGQTLCAVDGDDGGSNVCTDLHTDLANCGTCGKACDPTFECTLGTCACPSGQTNCDGTCADLTQDSLNCGGCDKVCGTDRVCITSALTGNTPTCLIFCTAGETNCTTACANLKTDSNHCSACDAGCPNEYSCQDGTCVNGCTAGQTVCGVTCTDLSNTTASCGQCGHSCALGAKCSGSSCACPSGEVVCTKGDAGACVAQSDTRCGPNCATCKTALGIAMSLGACTLAGQCIYDAGPSGTNGTSDQ